MEESMEEDMEEDPMNEFTSVMRTLVLSYKRLTGEEFDVTMLEDSHSPQGTATTLTGRDSLFERQKLIRECFPLEDETGGEPNRDLEDLVNSFTDRCCVCGIRFDEPTFSSDGVDGDARGVYFKCSGNSAFEHASHKSCYDELVAISTSNYTTFRNDSGDGRVYKWCWALSCPVCESPAKSTAHDKDALEFAKEATLYGPVSVTHRVSLWNVAHETLIPDDDLCRASEHFPMEGCGETWRRINIDKQWYLVIRQLGNLEEALTWMK